MSRAELALGLLSWPVCMVFPLTAVPIMSAFYERTTRLLGARTLDFYLGEQSAANPTPEGARRDWRAIVWYGATISLAVLMIAVPLALLTTAAKPLGVSWERAALGAIVLSLVVGLLLWSNRR